MSWEVYSYIYVYVRVLYSDLLVCMFCGSAAPAMFFSSYGDARVWRQTHVLHHDLIPPCVHACWVGWDRRRGRLEGPGPICSPRCVISQGTLEKMIQEVKVFSIAAVRYGMKSRPHAISQQLLLTGPTCAAIGTHAQKLPKSPLPKRSSHRLFSCTQSASSIQ